MATITHASLSGSSLHENKGAASASDDTVATASSGATVWKKLTAENLTGTGNPFGASLYHVQDQHSSGTAFSGTMTTSTWNNRPLNTEVVDEISGASLSSDLITLPIGTYYCEAYTVGRTGSSGSSGAPDITLRARLRDVSNNVTKVLSATEQAKGDHYSVVTVWNSAQAERHTTRPWAIRLSGRFALAAQSNLAFQLYNSNTITAMPGLSAAGEIEIYSDVKIWKIA
jgi:hypothetical protein